MNTYIYGIALLLTTHCAFAMEKDPHIRQQMALVIKVTKGFNNLQKTHIIELLMTNGSTKLYSMQTEKDFSIGHIKQILIQKGRSLLIEAPFCIKHYENNEIKYALAPEDTLMSSVYSRYPSAILTSAVKSSTPIEKSINWI